MPDDAAVCPSCGTPANGYGGGNYNNGYRPQAQSGGSYSTISIVGFVFAFLSPLIGLIISLVAKSNARNEGDLKSEGFAKTGAIIAGCFMGLQVIAGIIWIVVVLPLIIGGNYIPPDYYSAALCALI